MSHGDRSKSSPPGFSITGRTANTRAAVIESPERRLLRRPVPSRGHPHARGQGGPGQFPLSGWPGSARLEHEARSSSAKPPRSGARSAADKVICGLSGGVDSLVTSLIVHRAVGDRLTCVFVDNGLLRKGQYEELMDKFRRKLHLKVIGVDASDVFLRRLRGVDLPGAEKRRSSAAPSSRSSTGEARKIGGREFLAQGTIYPDVIESAPVKGPSATIKSHHNVGGLPKGLQVQPGRAAPRAVQGRGPGPGRRAGRRPRLHRPASLPGPRAGRPHPGRSHRRSWIASSARPTRSCSRKSARHGIYNKLWQAFAVLLPGAVRRRHGRPADLPAGRRPPPRPERRRHDRQLVPRRRRVLWRGSRPGSSTK